MSDYKKEFGFYPKPLHIKEGAITISTLPDLDSKVSEVSSDGVEKDWAYAPPHYQRDFMSGGVRKLPYPSRVFGLPKTHVIEHKKATSETHIDFHVWVLSFFLGMRLTTTKAGFLDVTPLKPGVLVDFVLLGRSLEYSVELAETFWTDNGEKSSQLFVSAIHALFLGQNRHSLQFEEFIYLCIAIDTCYALCRELRPPSSKVKYRDRIQWMCKEFEVKLPSWGNPKSEDAVPIIRNDTLHEGLFIGELLGFAIYDGGTFGNFPLEMVHLVCRLLVAMIGGKDISYLESRVDTRPKKGLRLC